MHWPNDYHGWTGSLTELVDTANTILRARDPHAPLVTVRTARHYQGEGMLGRGTKQGRSATFTFNDLAHLVSAKSLVNEGLPISYTSSVLASAPASNIAQALSPSGQKAADVVAQMMSQAAPSSTSAPLGLSALMSHVGGTLGGASASFSVPAGLDSLAVAQSLRSASPASATPTLSSQATPAQQPVPWLRLDIDEAALAQASSQERTTAAHALLHWAARLTAPTPRSSGE